MKFSNACIPLPLLWSSPFLRWQGRLADVSAIDLAHRVTDDALRERQFDRALPTQLILGTTIPQSNSFYGAPWLAARLGMAGIGGANIAQACATSVTALVSAALTNEVDDAAVSLVVTTDRTSNSPLLVYPRGNAMGGSPLTEHWLLQSFAADPNTGLSMVHTAENVARKGGFSRAQIDEMTLLRYSQYQQALADDRAFQRRYLQPVVLDGGKAGPQVIDQDDGIHPYSAAGLAKLRPVVEGGVVTSGAQTHPSDGTAGTVVCSAAQAASLSGGRGVVRLLAAGYARAEKAHMPAAATTAAQKALASAGLSIGDVKLAASHNPFAVNDLWFSQQTGFAPERMNVRGSSLIYGHPQGPTGLRGIAELAHALQLEGGGIGLFTGCAAGDCGAALLIQVD